MHITQPPKSTVYTQPWKTPGFAILLRNFISIEFLSSLPISLKPATFTAVSLPSPNPGKDSVCSFVRSRDHQLMFLGLSPKFCRWKPVGANTRPSSLATGLAGEKSGQCHACPWWVRQKALGDVFSRGQEHFAYPGKNQIALCNPA